MVLTSDSWGPWLLLLFYATSFPPLSFFYICSSQQQVGHSKLAANDYIYDYFIKRVVRLKKKKNMMPGRTYVHVLNALLFAK